MMLFAQFCSPYYHLHERKLDSIWTLSQVDAYPQKFPQICGKMQISRNSPSISTSDSMSGLNLLQTTPLRRVRKNYSETSLQIREVNLQKHEVSLQKQSLCYVFGCYLMAEGEVCKYFARAASVCAFGILYRIPTLIKLPSISLSGS
jgi:hypothetical protein